MFNIQPTGAISITTPYGSGGAVLGVYAMQLVNGRLYLAGNFGAINTFTSSYGLTSVDTMNTYSPGIPDLLLIKIIV